MATQTPALRRRLSEIPLVVLLAAAIASCGGSDGPSGPARPTTVQMLSGNNQAAPTGSDLPNPLMVEVLDARGNPVGGQTVTWSVEEGGGSVTPVTSITNASGQARSFLRVGPTPGQQRVHAVVGSLDPVPFAAMAHARPAGQLIAVQGNGQTANAGTALPQPIIARVLDVLGQPIVGATITFAVMSGGGSVNPASATSDADGRASAAWTLGATVGAQTVSAATPGVSPVTYSATATAIPVGARTLSILSGNNQSAAVSAVLASPLVVRLLDPNGAPVSGALVVFSTTAGGQLTPATATTNANGEASSSWRLGTGAGPQTVSVSSVNTSSIAFQATASPAAASQLTIVSGNNQTGATGTKLPNPVILRVSDAFDNAIQGVQVSFAVTAGGGSITPVTASTGADGRVIVEWTLGPTQGPNNATATVAGIGNAVLTATATPAVNMLAHRVVDAEFNQAIGKIITVSANPSRLHIVDPETKAVQTVDLPQIPSTVSVQPDGQFAAVGHDGWISHVNLTTRQVVRVYSVTTDVLDVILPGNGWVYAFPRRDQWADFRSINLTTGAESGTYYNYAGTIGRLHPSGKYIYSADNGLSPSDFQKYDIRTGAAVRLYDSPYHGDYAFNGNVWISEDGLRLFARSGNVFRSSEVAAEDMRYAGKLSGMNVVEGVVQSTGAGRVFALPGSTWDGPGAAELRIYDNAFLAFKGTVPLPQFLAPGVGAFRSHGRFVFTNAAGTRLYVLLQADGSAGLALDWGWVTYSTSELP